MSFPPVPKEIKPVAHLLKIADEHETRNIVVTYWARMAAVRLSLRLVPGKKTPEVSALLTALLDWLEETKKANSDNEGITSETTAQALIEEYALQLFAHGDQQDRAEIYNKNTIKTFYTAGMLMDILDQFTISDDIYEKRKYAKWKAAYIHNCLKTGDKPIPGAPNEHLGNIMPVSDLTDEERLKFDEELRNNQRASTSNVDPDPSNVFNLPSVPNIPSDNNIVAPAPASTPVTPSVHYDPPPFQPVDPSTPKYIPAVVPSVPLLPANGSSVALNPDQIQKAQKYCKYATSALNYDDIKTAIDNLTKALNMLQTGSEG